MDAKKNLVIDILALGAYAVVANPVFTGIAVHEWAGLGLVVVFLVHAAAHVDWAVDAVRTAYRDPSWVRRGNLVLDALIVVGFMVATVSGLMVSGTGPVACDCGEAAACTASSACGGARALDRADGEEGEGR